MELNSEVSSALSLINSGHIERDDLQQIFQDCLKTLTNSRQSADVHQSPDDRLMIRNLLTFAINSLLLESVKNNVNEASLVRLLQEQKFDCTTENFRLFIEFIHSTLPKVQHNMNHFELNPLPKFRGIEWSQVFDVKSSSIDSIKERSYLLDLYVDESKDSPEESSQQQQQPKTTRTALSMTLSKNELMDLHLTLRDCAKSLENLMSK